MRLLSTALALVLAPVATQAKAVFAHFMVSLRLRVLFAMIDRYRSATLVSSISATGQVTLLPQKLRVSHPNIAAHSVYQELGVASMPRGLDKGLKSNNHQESMHLL